MRAHYKEKQNSEGTFGPSRFQGVEQKYKKKHKT